MNKKPVSKTVWVKPKIESHELKLHALLGENGWMDKNLSVNPVIAYSGTG